MFAIGRPGRVCGGRFWEWASAAELLGVEHFCLGRELLVGGIGEGLVLVEDGHLSFRIFTDGDGCLLQGISGALGLDLVKDLVGLDGQVFGEHACFLVGEDPIQIVAGKQGTMGIMSARSGHRKASKSRSNPLALARRLLRGARRHSQWHSQLELGYVITS
jgi:hypothetical protein